MTHSKSLTIKSRQIRKLTTSLKSCLTIAYLANVLTLLSSSKNLKFIFKILILAL